MIVATNLTENMEERVKELLNRILHPETQHGLVESGFVEQVSTPGDKITVTLNFAKVRDPFALKIKRQVQAPLEENFPAPESDPSPLLLRRPLPRNRKLRTNRP